MREFKGLKISAAKTLQHLFIKDVGQLGPALSATQDGISRAIDMTLTEVEGGCFVVLKLKDKRGQEVTELVPASLFQQMTVSPE